METAADLIKAHKMYAELEAHFRQEFCAEFGRRLADESKSPRFREAYKTDKEDAAYNRGCNQGEEEVRGHIYAVLKSMEVK